MKADVLHLQPVATVDDSRQHAPTRQKSAHPLLSVLLRNRIPIVSSESAELKQTLIVEQAQAELPAMRQIFAQQRNGFLNLVKWTNSIWIPILSTAFAGSLMAMFLNREDPLSWQFGLSVLGLAATLVVFAGYLWLEQRYRRLYFQALNTRDALFERESCVWQTLPLEDFEVKVRKEDWFTFVASVVQKEVPDTELYVEYCSASHGAVFLKARLGGETYYIGR